MKFIFTLLMNYWVLMAFAQVGINTNNPQNTLEINSGIDGESGLRFSQLTSSTDIKSGQSIGVDENGDVVNVQSIGTVFIAKVLPGATIGTGFNFIPLEPLFDPENRYNSSTYQWAVGSADKSIYEVNVSLHRIDGPMPFNIFRPNSANLIYLPTNTGQYFYFDYNGISSKNTSTTKLLGAGYYGIYVNNNSGSTYTFDPSLVYVDRGYWTIVIKRIGFVQ